MKILHQLTWAAGTKACTATPRQRAATRPRLQAATAMWPNEFDLAMADPLGHPQVCTWSGLTSATLTWHIPTPTHCGPGTRFSHSTGCYKQGARGRRSRTHLMLLRNLSGAACNYQSIPRDRHTMRSKVWLPLKERQRSTARSVCDLPQSSASTRSAYGAAAHYVQANSRGNSRRASSEPRGILPFH